ncbi:flavin reductase family protein [Mesorhizobium sp. CGMCC 1.15528]|uniref:Flavin reductase family protein n=1 Tax=Mesorhizobium zhangyense TaxID=1776730 RepID=A0A7C9V9J9_9HYPH|nr:flavin reductase family protein [Mesorhizobium zhangyense]NGN39910.1 flavin reductase family protein [Mesorhizobium zhangyense]
MTNKTSFDFERMSEREKYKLLIGAVVPRPIALVTTVDLNGRVNAAPISFFNCLSAEPAILALGVENHDDLSFKDTAWNVRTTGVFTVNIVSSAMLDAMNVCAVPFSSDIDELAEAGLTAVPGSKIAAPRIAESPAAFECRTYVTLGVGNSREVILGEIVAAHIRSDVVNSRLHVDPVGLDAIGRMGGHGYALSRETFDLPTMSVAQWEERKRKPAAE